MTQLLHEFNAEMKRSQTTPLAHSSTFETTGISFMMPNTLSSDSHVGSKHTSHSFNICSVKWRLMGWGVRQLQCRMGHGSQMDYLVMSVMDLVFTEAENIMELKTVTLDCLAVSTY